MTTVIIEDEKPAARRLQRMLNDLNLKVTTQLHSVQEAIEWFSAHPHPDLIFLDIQLSDGLSFEIFEDIEIRSAIIFTTAYDEYALKAFKLNSVDYLLKPIDDEELEQAIAKFRQHSQKTSEVDITALQHLLQVPTAPTSYKSRFTIRVGQHLKVYPVEDLVCIYSHEKATYIHTREGRSYPIEVTLEDLGPHLDPAQFYRISRKFYVRINAIKDIINYTNSRLELKLHQFNEHEVIVSRERVKGFKEWLDS